jgi:hypothetical protein
MTWMTWRQLRTPVAVVGAVVAALGIALVIARPGLIDLYRSAGLDTCGAQCADQAKDFLLRTENSAADVLFVVGLAAVYLIPGIIGIFWGAPMVARELETGTYRLVWSQSTTRQRWLTVKLLAGAGAAMLLAGLLSLAVTWFSAPFDTARDNRLFAEVFGARGVVPIAYAALAFTLGVLIGTVLRRTVPAMALTLILIIVVQVVTPLFVRPHLIAPERYDGAITAEAGFEELMMGVDDGHMTVIPRLAAPGAWVLENRAVKADGTTFTGPYDPEFCGRDAGGPKKCEEWVADQNLHQEAIYQPASRFWPLQWRESALVLLVTVLLGALTFWWVRRRLS